MALSNLGSCLVAEMLRAAQGWKGRRMGLSPKPARGGMSDLVPGAHKAFPFLPLCVATCCEPGCPWGLQMPGTCWLKVEA